jgi:hypothetical protein
MSTPNITLGGTVYGVALLMNDPQMTEYNITSVQGYVALAMGELSDLLEEANIPTTNKVSVHPVNIGSNSLVNPPFDAVEFQEVAERVRGSNGPFIPLPRKEFPDASPQTNSLVSWSWQSKELLFNKNGANVPMEVQLRYIRRPGLGWESSGDDPIVADITSHQFLVYKAAALCARFIAEDLPRAALLEDYAEKAFERIVAISNKGRQQIMTRHRPFRAGYKMRGY